MDPTIAQTLILRAVALVKEQMCSQPMKMLSKAYGRILIFHKLYGNARTSSQIRRLIDTKPRDFAYKRLSWRILSQVIIRLDTVPLEGPSGS